MMPLYPNASEMPLDSAFNIAYTGPALDAGTMDVRDLAPALLSLSAIIEQVNRKINNDREISTNFKAVSKGSLIVTLTLETSIIQELISLFNSDGAQAVERVLAIVGGVGIVLGTARVGLFKLIALLRHQQPDAIVPGPTPSTVNITISNNTFLVDRVTLELATDPKIIKEAAQVVKPLERFGVDGLIFLGRSRDESTGDWITPDDLGAFSPTVVEEINEFSYRATMFIESPNLGDVRGKWRLTDGDGHFWARILDEHFLNAVERNAIRFGVNDSLLCDVTRRQTRQPSGLFKTEYEITQVISYQLNPNTSSGDDQLLLPLDDSPVPA